MIRDYNIAEDANIASRKLAEGHLLSHALKADPPSGFFRVTNLYVNPANGRLVVEYDDEPIA